MHRRISYFLFWSLTLLSACSDPRAVTTLEKKSENLESEIEDLKTRIRELEIEQLMDVFKKSVNLEAGSGYQILQADEGSLAVSLRKIEETDKHYELILNFGNMLATTITGFSANLTLLSTVNDKTARVEVPMDWKSTLSSGNWTIVKFTVPKTEHPIDSVSISDLNIKGIGISDILRKLDDEISDRKLQDLIGDNSIAYLTPKSKNYSVVNFDLGTLTVSLSKVEPYANGTQITLQFGNPLSADINGLEFALDYGQVNDGRPDNSGAKTTEHRTSKKIEEGSWNEVEIFIEIPPSQLGFVRVKSVKHSGVALRTAK